MIVKYSQARDPRIAGPFNRIKPIAAVTASKLPMAPTKQWGELVQSPQLQPHFLNEISKQFGTVPYVDGGLGLGVAKLVVEGGNLIEGATWMDTQQRRNAMFKLGEALLDTGAHVATHLGFVKSGQVMGVASKIVAFGAQISESESVSTGAH